MILKSEGKSLERILIINLKKSEDIPCNDFVIPKESKNINASSLINIKKMKI